MNCSCSIYHDVEMDYEDYEEHRNSLSSETLKCAGCSGTIKTGELHSVHYAVNYDCGKRIEQSRYFICSDCQIFLDEFFESGFYFDQVKDDVADMIHECNGEVSEKIISRLSKEGRDWICEEIEDAWIQLEEREGY